MQQHGQNQEKLNPGYALGCFAHTFVHFAQIG
jgi:hypothetical protein